MYGWKVQAGIRSPTRSIGIIAPSGETRYRWDNARHHAELTTFPDHVHIGPDEEARESGPTDLWRVLSVIEREI